VADYRFARLSPSRTSASCALLWPIFHNAFFGAPFLDNERAPRFAAAEQRARRNLDDFVCRHSRYGVDAVAVAHVCGASTKSATMLVRLSSMPSADTLVNA